MQIRKRLVALVSAALAIALVAMPAAALAEDTVTITDADLDATTHVYSITSAGKYQLGGDLHGAINVSGGFSATIDLNGHSIIPTSDTAADAVSLNARANVLVSNGSVTQSNASYTTFRLNTSSTLTLRDVTATATNHPCVDAESGIASIWSGAYTVNNTGTSDPSAVIRASKSSAVVNLYGGTYVNNGGDEIASTDSGSSATNGVRAYAGTYSNLPNTWYDSGKTALCETDGTYTVDYADALCARAKYIVRISDAPKTVYFASEDAAKAFAQERGSAAELAWLTVHFDTDGGSEMTDQSLFNGKVAQEPSAPTKDEHEFQYWTLDGSTEYEFDTPVTEDITLKAVWKKVVPVASIGSKTYTSLQAALDAAKDGDTVKLLDSVEESVEVTNPAKIKLDLNKKTLTSDSQTIVLYDSANLTIDNGTVEATDGDAIVIRSDDATLTVNGGEVRADLSAIWVSSGKLYVNGGNFTGDNDAVIFCNNTGWAEINGGTFSSTDDATLYAFSSMTINGGRFDGYVIYDVSDTDLSVTGGTFSNPLIAFAVVDGKKIIENTDGRYEVVDAAKAKSRANWVVASDYGNGCKAYFINEDSAKAFYDELSDEAPQAENTIKAIHRVTFVAQGKTVEVRALEEDETIGTLPAAKQFSGYKFLGWYVDGDYVEEAKISADDTISANIKVEALWLKDGSDTPDTNPAGEDSGSKNSDAKATPQTGDAGSLATLFAAAGSAVAAAGAFRRRK